jgi:peptidoglycan-associated lipoprotein
MSTRHRGSQAMAALGVLGVALGLAGCAARVKREEFNTEVTKLREEMQAGDQKVATRIDSTNQTLADHARRLDALEQELQAFRSEYKVSMEKVKTMLKFDVPVHFDFASSDLREADRPVLDRFASVVKEYYPGAIITVEGFTDPAGSETYNRRLGQRRAESVREYLATSGGFNSATIRAVSYGEVRNRQVVPGAKGPGDEGVENRRVALVIDHSAIASDQVTMR